MKCYTNDQSWHDQHRFVLNLSHIDAVTNSLCPIHCTNTLYHYLRACNEIYWPVHLVKVTKLPLAAEFQFLAISCQIGYVEDIFPVLQLSWR